MEICLARNKVSGRRQIVDYTALTEVTQGGYFCREDPWPAVRVHCRSRPGSPTYSNGVEAFCFLSFSVVVRFRFPTYYSRPGEQDDHRPFRGYLDGRCPVRGSGSELARGAHVAVKPQESCLSLCFFFSLVYFC